MKKPPIVLLGETRSQRNVDALRARCWGRMFVTSRPTPYEGEPWGFDNGAFVAWCKGEGFPEIRFLRRLDVAIDIGIPHMAVAPDIVAGGLHSLDFSLKWIDKLPTWPWYLAVQDGMTPLDVIPVLPRFAGIFMGGSDSFKAAAWKWCAFAHDHGKPFHYARAGTLNKLEAAMKMRADSLDSAFPLWTTARMTRFMRQYDWNHANPRPSLDFGSTAL